MAFVFGEFRGIHVTIEYPRQDFGFSFQPREELIEGILDGGPLNRLIMHVDAIEEREVDGGHYKRDPAVTYAPTTGCRYAVYRFVTSG